MLQPKGAALLGASLALISVGFIRIDGILITLGASGMLVLLVACMAGRWNLQRLSLTIRAPARTCAGQPFDLRLTLHNNRALLDAFHVEMQLALSDQSLVRGTAAWTAARSMATSRHRVALPARDAVAQHKYTLSSTAPLGLFRFSASGTTMHEILVFPRPLTPGELFTHGALHDASRLPGLTPGNAPGEPRGIRPWQPGDQAKRIHWPASARSLHRRRGLRIRENDPPGFHPQHCTVLFHSFGSSGELIREDRFDRALSLVCGTIRYLRDHGIPATLLADFLRWEPHPISSRGNFATALDMLARAERAPDTEAHDLGPVIAAVPQEHSLLVLSDMPPEAWAHVLPERAALLIDIRQHHYGTRTLATRPLLAASP
jgi:uncharacterized protein (DUF58 family)